MLAAVEPAASEAKFDNEMQPDIRRIRWELDIVTRQLDKVFAWLRANHPDDFPEELHIG